MWYRMGREVSSRPECQRNSTTPKDGWNGAASNLPTPMCFSSRTEQHPEKNLPPSPCWALSQYWNNPILLLHLLNNIPICTTKFNIIKWGSVWVHNQRRKTKNIGMGRFGSATMFIYVPSHPFFFFSFQRSDLAAILSVWFSSSILWTLWVCRLY